MVHQELESQFKDSDRQSLMDKLDRVLAQQNDLLSAHYLAPLSSSYLPWSRYAMRPSGLLSVLNDIMINNRTVILECGGGISTFYIARLLKNIKSRDGHLYSLENNPEWLKFLQDGLEKEGLADWVTLIEAPLKPTDLAIDRLSWYCTEAISQQFPSDKKIDLLLVDGPPAYDEKIQYSRYPAVPYFLSYLKDDFTIAIDDVNRKGEQEIVKRWEKLLNLKFEITDGDIAIARTNHQ